MSSLLKRVFWLALLGGAGYAVWIAWQRRREVASGEPPEWPPLPSDDGAGGDVVAATTSALTELGDVDATGADARADAAGSASDAASSATTDATTPSGGADGRTWVEPTDGACPASHPIKANDNSGIYHVPGGRFYERTGAERCYRDPGDAAADGYRPSKS